MSVHPLVCLALHLGTHTLKLARMIKRATNAMPKFVREVFRFVETIELAVHSNHATPGILYGHTLNLGEISADDCDILLGGDGI